MLPKHITRPKTKNKTLALQNCTRQALQQKSSAHVSEGNKGRPWYQEDHQHGSIDIRFIEGQISQQDASIPTRDLKPKFLVAQSFRARSHCCSHCPHPGSVEPQITLEPRIHRKLFLSDSQDFNTFRTASDFFHLGLR